MNTMPRDRVLTGVSLVYLALAVLWAAPSSLSPWDTLPDLGDPLHLSYVMAWDAHQLVRRPWALFESNSFYPYPRSLAFGDHLLPEAILVAPVNWAIGNAVLASNIAVLLGLVLSGVAMFLLMREVTGSWDAGFVSGLVYAFNSFSRHEILRVHVLHVQWWPLALLGLHRFVRHGRRRDAFLFAGGLLLQGLSGSYYLVYTVLLSPIWVAVAYLVERRWPTRRESLTLAGAATLAAGLGAGVLWPYLPHLRAMGFEKSLSAGADVLSFVDPPEGSPWSGLLAPGAPASETPHFLGVAGLVVILLGGIRAVRGRTAIGRIALATTGLGLLLSFGPSITIAGTTLAPGPYLFLHRHILLLRGMASPERFGILVVLGGAMLVGFAASELLGRSPRPRAATAVVLGLGLVVEHWTPAGRAAPVPTGREVPEVYRFLAAGPGTPVVELPVFPERRARLRAAYLYFSTYHWRPIPIGRTSFYPPAHEYLAWHLRNFPDDTSLAMLERLGIRTIVVHPRLWTGDERQERMAALAADPRLHLIRRFEDQPTDLFEPLGLGEEQVYQLEVTGEAERASQPCVPSQELAREAWSFRSSGRKLPELVRDDDRRTAWFTERPQRPGDFFEVVLPAPQRVEVVSIELYYPFDEFPRDPVLLVETESGQRLRLVWRDGLSERVQLLDLLVRRPREARMLFQVEPTIARRIRIRLGLREQDHSWPAWSIPELRIYGACR